MATGGIVLIAVLFSLSTFNVNFCHAIEFQSLVYTYNISEEAVGASETLCALATLPVASSNAQDSVKYSFVDVEFSNLFQLTTNSKREMCLQNLDLLDREIRESYSFTYRASSFEGNAETTILLTLLDVNDHAPEFDQDSLQSFTVDENSDEGTLVGNITAIDPDKAENGTVRYTLTRCNNVFQLGELSGLLTVKSNIDYETDKSFECNVTATDSGQEFLRNSVVFTVSINNINDNAECSPGQIVIVSESARNQFLGSVNCSDPDDNSNLTFSLRSVWRGGVQSNEGSITVTNSGKIRVADPIDYDNDLEKTLTLSVAVTDDTFTTLVNVTLQIIDVNDNPPCFSQRRYNFSILENSNSGSEVGSVHATDADSGSNSVVVYSISSLASIFSINATTGQITTKQVLDREEKEQYEFNVMASDGGHSDTCSRAVVLVHVTNLDDSCPTFHDNYTFIIQVNQNIKAGTVVGSISAANPEGVPADNITYNLESAPPYIILQLTNSIVRNLILNSELNENHVGKEKFMAIVSSSSNPSCSVGEKTYIELHILRFDPMGGTELPFLQIIVGVVAGLLLVIIVILFFIIGVCFYCVKRQKSITDTYPITNSPTPTSPLELKKHKSILKPCPSESPGLEDPRQKKSVRFVEVISTDDVYVFDKESPPLSPWFSNGHADGKVLEDLDSPEQMHESSSSIGAFEEDSQSLTSSSSFPHQLNISDNINQAYELDLPRDGYRPPTPPQRRSAEAHLSFAPTNQFQPEHLSSFSRYYSTNNPAWYDVEQDIVRLPSNPQRPNYCYQVNAASVIMSDDLESLSDNYSMYTEPGTDITCGPMESLIARMYQTQQTKRVNLPVKSTVAKLCFTLKRREGSSRTYRLPRVIFPRLIVILVNVWNNWHLQHFNSDHTTFKFVHKGSFIYISKRATLIEVNLLVPKCFFPDRGSTFNPSEADLKDLHSLCNSIRDDLTKAFTMACTETFGDSFTKLANVVCGSLCSLCGPEVPHVATPSGGPGKTLMCPGKNQPFPMTSKQLIWFSDIDNSTVQVSLVEGIDSFDPFWVLGPSNPASTWEGSPVSMQQIDPHKLDLGSKPCESDMLQLVGYCYNPKWKEFGIRMGISGNTCEGISQHKSSDPDAWLALLCSKWLSYEAGTGDKPRTWRTVLGALRKCGFPGVAVDQVPADQILKLPGIHSKPCEADLLELVGDYIDSKWKKFGIELGILSNLCEGIKQQKLCMSKECFILLCSKWLSSESGTGYKPRTWRTVLEAVRECGFSEVADQVEQYFSKNPGSVYLTQHVRTA